MGGGAVPFFSLSRTSFGDGHFLSENRLSRFPSFHEAFSPESPWKNLGILSSPPLAVDEGSSPSGKP